MKKFLSIGALLLAFTLGANAQEKKSWDFTKGLSDETIANLNADAANWASNGQDGEGVTNNWKNAKKQDAGSYWTANGQVIEELRGLKIDIGSNKDNSIHLATTKLRLTRKSTKITFPKLANGQKVTIVGRSANGSATNRGIAPVQSHLKFQAEESSPQYNGACIFVGNQVEGSEGTYTFVWKVETEGTDSVDIQFQLTPEAGIDFTLFMIDQGDAPAVKEAQPVGYLYAGDVDIDYAHAYLSGADAFSLTDIDVTTTEANVDSLRKFQALVISPTIAADNAYMDSIKQVIAYVPVLNLNTAIYEKLGYGKAVATEATSLTIKDSTSIVFEGLDMENGIELLTEGGITGVVLGDYFAKDDTLAMAGEAVAMHIHNAKRNAYLLLPLNVEDMLVANQDVISELIPQALQMVTDTKKEVKAVGTPVIAVKQNDGSTEVTITAANSNAIYYTIDGTDPTVESTLYTEPFTLTDSTVVKAFATGDGYTDSEIGTKKIIIMVKAATPEINIAREAGKSTITITAAEGTKAYFNFNEANSTALSQAYTEPIELTEPACITVMADGENLLPSDLVSQYIGIDGIDKTTIRLDTLAHFDANQTDWFINDPEACGEATPKASAYYFWGKSAWNYYTDEIDHTDVAKDGEGNPIKSQVEGQEDQDSIITYYKVNPEALKVINPLNENGWVLKSEGQLLTGELQLTPEAGVGNGATGRFAEEAIDLIGTPSKGVITFGGKISGDPYTARIESTKKLAGPFDVIVYCGNGNNGAGGVMVVQTSDDGETWTTLDTLKMASTQRYIKRTRMSYNETAEVFLRVAHVSGSTKAQVYDILVMNNGELSQAYDEAATAEQTGIQTVQPRGNVIRTEIFTLGGSRMNNAGRGMQIVRKTYANGVVKIQKMLMK